MTQTVFSPLRAGVIGVGVFGGHHCGKYVDHPDTDLKAVFDPDVARAQVLADRYGAAVLTDLDAFLAGVDVVTIASPGVTHGALARRVLEAGKSALVEKPLALSALEARALVDLATDKGLVLACGHQERLVFEAMRLTGVGESPTYIYATRQGVFDRRGADVSITFDLMVHDIDLALMLIGQNEPADLTAQGRVVKTNKLDDVTMQAVFDNGARLELNATRVADKRRRIMRLEYESGAIEIDFIARTFQNFTGFNLNSDYHSTPEGRDPLGANVAAFIDAVLGRADAPAVTGRAGAAAVALAERVDAAVTRCDGGRQGRRDNP